MAAHTLSALRVEESNNKLLESERKLQGERLRAVLLEQHLEKLRLEPGKTAPRSKTGRGQPCYKGRRLPAPHLTLPLLLCQGGQSQGGSLSMGWSLLS